MISDKSIELVCINYHENFRDALTATKWCLDQFPHFDKVTIFNPNTGNHILYYNGDHKEWKIYFVEAVSMTQHFCCLHEMPQHLECDFALSIQWDGYIVRPDLWDNRFLEYDYIAPPWPLKNIINPDHRVGSGGFCMFSKKLAQYWSKHGDPLIPNDWERGAVNRKKYEEAGFTFAPIDLSIRFGKEHDLEDLEYPEALSFGFHDFRLGNELRQQFKEMVYR